MDSLDQEQRKALGNAGLLTALDVLVLPHHELARKLHVVDARHIIDAISRAIAPQPVIIDNSFKGTAESISTGDDAFDALLGGGITTGAIWEVVGESSCGKTQLALQLSLMALLSPTSGHIERSTCYITSSGELPTERLVQIFKNHPKLSHVAHSHERLMLDNTQQRQITSRHQLLQALSDDLPKLAEHRILLGMPLKLIVIDALTPLVQPEGKANTAKLSERSQHLVEISGLLRSLAWKYGLAVLVLNHVTDVFDNNSPSSHGRRYNQMDYKCQANWFSRTPLHLSQEGVTSRKEASLGLVWANQLNARIMLSRTSRKRPMSDLESGSGPLGNHNVAKRQRLNIPAPPETKFSESESATIITSPPPLSTTNHSSSSTPVRKFSVLYSAYGAPGTLSYVILDSGVRAFQDDPSPPPPQPPAYPTKYETPPKPMTTEANPLNRSSTSIKEELTEEEWALYFPEVFQPGIHGTADELDLDLDFDEDALGGGANLKSEMGDPPDLGVKGEEPPLKGPGSPLGKMGSP